MSYDIAGGQTYERKVIKKLINMYDITFKSLYMICKLASILNTSYYKPFDIHKSNKSATNSVTTKALYVKLV